MFFYIQKYSNFCMVLNHKTEPRKYRNETRKGKKSRRDLPAETREELESRDSMTASFFFYFSTIISQEKKISKSKTKKWFLRNQRRQRNDFWEQTKKMVSAWRLWELCGSRMINWCHCCVFLIILSLIRFENLYLTIWEI